METINLFGASGHAKVIMDIIEAQGDNVGVLYDDIPHCKYIHEKEVLESKNSNVVGPIIVSIGSNELRKSVVERYNISFAKAIHPKSIVSAKASVGNGSVVMQGAIIQSDTIIGNHCIINTAASIDHECKIGNYVHVSPHATLCGNVTVGEGTWIGAASTVIPGIKIGKWCKIGAGSLVLKDIPDGATAYGNPCVIKK